MASPRPELQNLLAQAIEHHQAGRLAQAEGLYQKIIARDPRHADALRLLGVVAHQTGRHELAVELLRQAIAAAPRIAEYHNNLGLALHALGRHAQAIEAFQAALRLKPNLAEAHYNLANTLKADGQIDHAIATYQVALELQPRYPEAYNNMGNALKDRQQLDQAIKAYRAALAINPNFPPAWSNLGNALQSTGEYEQAAGAYQEALRLQPDDPLTLNNLGGTLAILRQFAPAIACYQAALRLNPRYAGALFNLGNTYQQQRRYEEAAGPYRAALALQPNYPEAQNNLGNIFRRQGRAEEAIAAYRAALELQPDFAEAHNNLGTSLKDHGQMDAGVAALRAALRHKPDYAEAWSNLGSALKEQGLMDEAIAAYRQAVECRPAAVELHNNLIYALHFHPGYDPQALAGELAFWNARHAQPLARLIQPLANDRAPDRPLRVGLVSPDFRGHPIGRFLLPLFAAHDATDCQLFCYSDHVPAGPDRITTQLRAGADRWHDTADLTHKELAGLIRLDRVDILLDLTMHMEGSRLLTFALKPAPIQITYLAYPTSTGMETMDYRLTDAAFDPRNAGVSPAGSIGENSPYTEKSLHLRSYWCYPPPVAAPESAPPVAPLPALAAGHITLACLNNFSKVSPQALHTWIKILHALPDSRLFLHAAPGSHRDRLHATLAAAGIAPARCEFFGFLPFAEYLALHHRIDLALDPFPYAGGTTSCDALYMGVPLVTWAGPAALSRGGVSILSALGLPELIGATPEAYVDIAVGLGKELGRLEQLRATLRQRMEASVLMDGRGFARDFQETMRRAWTQ